MSAFLQTTIFLLLLVAVYGHSKYRLRTEKSASDTEIVLERQRTLSKYISQQEIEKIVNMCENSLVMLEDGTKKPVMTPHDYFQMLMTNKVQKIKFNNLSIMRHPWDPRWVVNDGTYELLYKNGTISTTRSFIHYWSVNSPYYLLNYWQTF